MLQGFGLLPKAGSAVFRFPPVNIEKLGEAARGEKSW
jgi:hypothetical protein